MPGDVSSVTRISDARSGKTLLYSVNLSPEGYVLMSPDDAFEPVIAFSNSGFFLKDPENPLWIFCETDMKARLKSREDDVGRDSSSRAEGISPSSKWKHLLDYDLAKEKLPAVDDPRVDPFVQSRWGQSNVSGKACYNYFTPQAGPAWIPGSSGNYVCGCVATAMSQLMRYHKFPISGVGTGTFSIRVDGTEVSAKLRGGDGSGGSYAWGLMPLAPDASSTAEQRQAIGALCHDAGLSVNMSYTSDASGSSLLGTSALKNTFGYANSIQGQASGNIPLDKLKVMLNPNMDAKSPCLLGINASGAGHAVVCDGYGYSNSTLYHHIILGWSGSYDAWYNLPDIDTGYYDFDTVRLCAYNVFPSQAGEIVSGRVTDASGSPVQGVAVTATSSSSTYSSATDSRGLYALIVPSSTSILISCPGYIDRSAKTGYSSSGSVTVGNLCDQDFKIGTGFDVAFGSVINIKPADVGLNGYFSVKPSISTVYMDPVSRKAGKKASLATLTKTPKDSVNAEWKKKIKLYSKKNYKGIQLGPALKSDPIDSITLGWILVKSAELGKLPVETSLYLNFRSAVISAVEGDFGSQGGTFIVKGTFFGSTPPAVLVEYQDAKGIWKYQRCKVDKPSSLRYMNGRGKSAKSCMKIYSTDAADAEAVGYSQVTAFYPALKGTPSGYVIIDNSVSLAAFQIQ